MQSRSMLSRYRVAGIFFVGIAVFGTVGCGTGEPGDHKADGAVNVTSFPAIPSQIDDAQMAAMTSEVYAQLDTAPRINHYVGRIDEWRAGAWDVMQPFLTPAEAAVIDNNLPSDKRTYSPQQILNAYAIDVFDASSQGDTSKKIDEGRKMLSVVMSPDNPNFDELRAMIGNGQGAIKTVERAVAPDFPLLRNVIFRGYSIGEAGARIIRAEDISSSKHAIGYSLYRLMTVPNGQIWEYTTQFSIDDPTLASDIAVAIKNSN